MIEIETARNSVIEAASQTAKSILKGTEMPALPPSVLSVMNSSRTNGSFSTIREFILAEHNIQTDYVISGQSQSRVRVRR